MKLYFNPVHKIPRNEGTSMGLEALRTQFCATYRQYVKLRSIVTWMKQTNHFDSPLLIELNEFRALLARLAMMGYQFSPTRSFFKKWIRDTLAFAAGASQDMIEEFLLGSYLYPSPSVVSPDHKKRTPSPVEAILTTTENLGIMEQIADIAEPHATGLLFSGAHAWGPFYDTRGKLPKVLVDQGILQRESRFCSDIDCTITFDSVSEMSRLLGSLWRHGMTTEADMRHYDTFLQLFRAQEADIFSVSMRHNGIEINCDCMLNKTLESATRNDWQHRDGHHFYFRALKTSLPPNDHLEGGYRLYDSTVPNAQRFDMFDTMPREIESPYGGLVSYISRKPIMGYATTPGDTFLSIDVIGFYLLVAPVIAIDKNDSLSEHIERMRVMVEKSLDGKPPQYIVREERMPPQIRVNIGRYIVGLPY